MSHTPHELTEEFPGQETLIHDLKQNDAHFHLSAERYHDINRAIHRAETNVEPTDQLNEAQMRKERMRLKTGSRRCCRHQQHLDRHAS